MTDQTPITLPEIEMWRGHLLGLLPHQTFAMPRATLDLLLDLAAAALSHPAALERARAEERERCARFVTDGWKQLQAPDMYAALDLENAYSSGVLDAAESIAAAIRALGSAPIPEAPVAPSAANFEMPTTYRSVPTVTTGGTLPPATPPAMPADLRERARAALDFTIDQLDELINRFFGGELPCTEDQVEKFDAARALLTELEGSDKP